MSAPGAPSPGVLGGHIGESLTFAYCPICRVEWVWIAAGVPPSMHCCGCPENEIVVVNFKAKSHGKLSEFIDVMNPSSEQQGDTAHNPADSAPISREAE